MYLCSVPVVSRRGVMYIIIHTHILILLLLLLIYYYAHADGVLINACQRNVDTHWQ